jgi:vacuolar-type H+-ATPase subunit F/Vma7
VNVLSGDSVSLGTGTGSFADKNAGTGKAVTVTGFTLTGTDAANYVLSQPAGLTADVTQASLAVSGVTASNKVYDATTTASLGGTASVSGLSGDSVSVAGTGAGSFTDKNVGSNKAVSVTGYSLVGTDAGNYTLVQPAGVTASITTATLAITGVAASSKVYDASTTASFTGTAAVGAFLGDDVTVAGTGSGSFVNKNVGAGKAVAVTGFTLTGADAMNYVATQPTGLTANITQASLAVTGVTASSKVYDATTTASLGGTASVGALESRFAYDQMYYLVALAFFVAVILVWKTNLPAHRDRIEALTPHK